MIQRLLVLALTIVLLCGQSPITSFPPGMFANRASQDSGGGGGGGCSQATSFLARTSGLDSTHQNAYTTMICGMVTDGTWTQLEVLYIFATDTTTNALLNLISTSYTPVDSSMVFTADQGYNGTNGTAHLDSTFVPSTNCSVCSQDSFSMGVYDLSNRTSSDSTVIAGTTNGTQFTTFQLLASSNLNFEINAITFPSASNTTTKGAWVATRTASNAEAVYKNGSTTAFVSSSTTSTGTVAFSVYFCGYNNSGSVNGGCGDQLGAAFIGKGLSAADAVAINNRINTYMSSLAVPVNVY